MSINSKQKMLFDRSGHSWKFADRNLPLDHFGGWWRWRQQRYHFSQFCLAPYYHRHSEVIVRTWRFWAWRVAATFPHQSAWGNPFCSILPVRSLGSYQVLKEYAAMQSLWLLHVQDCFALATGSPGRRFRLHSGITICSKRIFEDLYKLPSSS